MEPKEQPFVPLRAPWVTLRLSPQTLPARIYRLDTLNQFSMCQALPNRAKTGPSIQNIGCFGMKVGSARLRFPSRPAVLALCLSQMATCGKITGMPDSQCIYVTNCAASYAQIMSQQKNHFHRRTRSHQRLPRWNTRWREDPTETKVSTDCSLYSINSPQHTGIWIC